ncbi:hypothetical protein CKY28_14555 [Sphingomonas lenta]|uniref:Type II toxin-antitoxin system prevent-host-death family antitoxin n=2 Tax=Sphingomonas lenta TaxID=1141887 RepID=A0A2A2SDV3_9SPHN|nr:hypothetical protein CKY28_14555 [Sphingomonas lenta]
MATVINIKDADEALAGLYDRLAAGEEIVLARATGPRLKVVAQPAPPERSGKRVPGSMRGQFTVPDSFFDPLPEEELRAWEGG